MLDNETNLDSGSIQWLDGEDAFVILDQNKFEKVCSIRSLLSTPLFHIIRLHCIASSPSFAHFSRILSPNTLLRSSFKASSENCIDGVSRGLLPHTLVITNLLLPRSQEALFPAQRHMMQQDLRVLLLEQQDRYLSNRRRQFMRNQISLILCLLNCNKACSHLCSRSQQPNTMSLVHCWQMQSLDSNSRERSSSRCYCSRLSIKVCTTAFLQMLLYLP